MDNVKIEKITDLFGTEYEWVNIDHGNGEHTSMSKAHYDELKANESGD